MRLTADLRPPSGAIRLHGVIIKHRDNVYFFSLYSLPVRSVLNVSVIHVLFISNF